MSALLPDHMSERELDDHVARIVKDANTKFPYRDPLNVPRPRLLAYHTRDSRRSPAGFPDWCFAGLRGVMFRENKTAKKNPSPMQREWIHALRMAGADVAVWRPADLASGLIAYELLRLAGLEPAKPATGFWQSLSPAAAALIDQIMEDE